MGAYCVSVSSIQERYHDPANSVIKLEISILTSQYAEI